MRSRARRDVIVAWSFYQSQNYRLFSASIGLMVRGRRSRTRHSQGLHQSAAAKATHSSARAQVTPMPLFPVPRCRSTQGLSAVLSCATEYTLMGGWKAIVAKDALRRLPNGAGEEVGGHSVVRTFMWRCVLNVLQVRPAAPHHSVQ